MTIEESVELLMLVSEVHPHKGVLNKQDQLTNAISLAALCKKFAEKSQDDEALNCSSEHWEEVILKLTTNSLPNVSPVKLFS